MEHLFQRLSAYDKLTKKNRPWFVLCAVLVCGLLFGAYFACAERGFGMLDESFYLTITDRLAKGQRFLLDEWHLTQFTALFQYLPFLIYTKLTGSTDGVLLFMRYVYFAALFFTYWYIVFRFRARPLRAVASAFLFCSFIPMGIPAVNYYTLPPVLMLGVCMILTGGRGRLFPLRLILAGILYSAVVLLVPGMTLVWIVYCAAVLARGLGKKKGRLAAYAFALDPGVWKYILVGVLLSAGAFLLYLQRTAGLQNVFAVLPELFTDAEYKVDPASAADLFLRMFDNIFDGMQIGAGGSVYLFFWSKLTMAVRVCGPVLCLLACAVTVYAAAAFRKPGEPGRTAVRKRAVFLIAGITAAASYGYSFYYTSAHGVPEFTFPSIPPIALAWLCLICHLLCGEKDRRAFFFWICGVLLSVAKDLLSDVSLACGLILCVIAWVMILPRTLKELLPAREEGRGRTRRPAVPKSEAAVALVCALAVLVTAVWAGKNVLNENRYTTNGEGKNEDDYTVLLEKGPCRGLLCSPELSEKYNAVLADLDHLSETTKEPIYIMGLLPYGYLYYGADYAVYSAYYVDDDAVDRQERYWRLQPEKRPGIVYAETGPSPYVNETDALIPGGLYEAVDGDYGWFSGAAVKGNGGVLVTVDRWGAPEAFAPPDR